MMMLERLRHPQAASIAARSPTGARGSVRVRVVAHPADAPIAARKQPAPTPPLVPGWSSWHWRRFWRSTFVEGGHEIPANEIEGELPLDLEGTFFRAGPGCTELPSGAPMHPFDGHGLVAKVVIKDGRATTAQRFVHTKAYAEEVADKGKPGAGVVRSRGFMTDMPGGMVGNVGHTCVRNTANTSIVEYGGRVLATWEGGRAHTLDPNTLQTLGEEDVQGLWKQGQPFSAHPHYDPKTGNTAFFGADSVKGVLWIAEVDKNSKPVFNVEYKMPDPSPYLHDFIITDHWYVFYCAPTRVNLPKWVGYLAGANPMASAIEFHPELPGQWLLYPRLKSSPSGPLVLEAPSQFIWHFVNAFEDPLSGRVVVDAVVANTMDMAGFDPKARPEGVQRSTLRRFTLNPLQRKTIAQEVLLGRHVDFPQINPASATQPHQFVYLVGSKTAMQSDNVGMKSVIKFHTPSRSVASEWTAPEGCFVQEAVFAPRNGRSPRSKATGSEDDGYLITLMFDAEAGGAPEGRSTLLILDAKDLGAGPIAAVWLRSPIPCGFHNLWSGTAYL